MAGNPARPAGVRCRRVEGGQRRGRTRRGNEFLAAVGQITAAILRRGDRAFRVGGDEFAVILPNSDGAIGLEVGRRMLTSALGGGDPSAPIEPFSLSIGVSAYPDPGRRDP